MVRSPAIALLFAVMTLCACAETASAKNARAPVGRAPLGSRDRASGPAQEAAGRAYAGAGREELDGPCIGAEQQRWRRQRHVGKWRAPAGEQGG